LRFGEPRPGRSQLCLVLVEVGEGGLGMGRWTLGPDGQFLRSQAAQFLLVLLEGFDFVLKDGLGLGQLSELLLPPPLLFEGLARDGLEDGSIVRVL
jgi:hypothetical protein